MLSFYSSFVSILSTYHFFSFGYVKSFFYEPAVGSPQIFTDPKAQQVFLHCIQYLTINGLGALFDRIEVLTERRLANISLAKEFNASSLAILMEKIKYDVESSAGQSNFSELVVPVARVRFLGLVGNFLFSAHQRDFICIQLRSS